MDDLNIWKLLAQYGLAGIFAGIIGWILYRVGLRMIAAIDNLVAKVTAAIDKLGDKLDAHTKVDVEYHNEVQQDLVAIKTRIDTALELTPVEGVRVQTSPRGVPVGEYSHHRPRTRNDGDR